MNQTVLNYVLPNGQQPIEDWLVALKDAKGRAKIRARINRIRSGNPGNFKMVESGILEMKLDFGPGYRIYYAKVGDKIILLLCGGDKITQNEDIKKATEYLNDYKRRMKEYE
ncbi:MAG: type II toxin-antitoxin system RelE/ParE family toxin [Candidatus Riflebacteria bacterium]|nr:type II toxin-antitoxin system RelE/ParE family toxin [Candidatus Riflebacteria bacterium]